MTDPLINSQTNSISPTISPSPMIVNQDPSKQLGSVSVDDTSDDYVNETFPLIAHWRDSFNSKEQHSNEFCIVISVLMTMAALIILFIICIIVIILFVLLKRR
ncbi:hypothetical protein EHI8A_000720 [Entamoeba histolytica HM-1:IMSS-B]|uniref:Uncharacterized protein n=6 Tax=Entamoeba histolytica TaxID=5759 RepID=C4LYY3_ENTH1|nr:hypothetical protein EHI_117990 [Entamoeba histolytica HM-1:IMSS]EMD42715.1 Hypothetical protein EHI5A_002570 [Entamoeba histolytica KU27]EMH72968.1 hypothetical protein EHI8A_000720 [Entamoeba histolytica HM-1:IMSS-B]EMS15679.1 hypothetical protein KM1_003440 [Entamoeba histolytica HM-3:IMSS]ENY63369.1 hypothetical protein EHI7A_000720 [Entamoeba histolytica HM-1:IMSS-A]GAT94050.1 hypothetical protein CL6EHI_117990 [Entamoeba histolytica]|eukprot:XP_656057.1 hypothetical protein EHI_117990 [Entamoeba histolytica HM-1:IMSS]